MECPIVNCSLAGCRSSCSSLGWFGNLSDCTVILQYQNNNTGLWHSLGTYGPGVHTELGSGVLLLPSDANLRVIKEPKHSTGNNDHVDIVLNYGRINNDISSLYVDNTMCQEIPEPTKPMLTLENTSEIKTSNNTSNNNSSNNNTWIKFFIFAGIGILVAFGLYRYVKNRQIKGTTYIRQ